MNYIIGIGGALVALINISLIVLRGRGARTSETVLSASSICVGCLLIIYSFV
ncbi:hypothetical protein [Paenirhodobacter populi]|uniref:hypothetical protein n=1 Tax=Paenirhodobacter populi TaxID=2306993 RepID=UPI0013E395BD|nr:hypothetical protein [Sinirhodobacter populi]